MTLTAGLIGVIPNTQRGVSWLPGNPLLPLLLCRISQVCAFLCLETTNSLNPWFLTYVIFSCNQAALRALISVCPSLRRSVSLYVRLSHLFDNVPFIVSSGNYQEILPSIDRRDVHVKGQRSKIKATEVMTPLSRFRTVTPVSIHIWRSNYAQSLMLLRRGALLFSKVICQISRSHG